MTLSQILKTDYSGRLIYRTDWDKFNPHKAIKLSLTSAELVYVDDKYVETMEYDYKFSLYECLCVDWEFYK